MTTAADRASAAPFEVVMTCGFFEPGFRAGGPIRSVARIVDTISDQVNLTLITSDRDFQSTAAYDGLSGKSVTRGQSEINYLNARSGRQLLGMLLKLRARPVDLLYVNSLWTPTFTVLPILAARLGAIKAKRVVIAPRGELSPGALSLKGRKKQLALRIWGPVLRGMQVEWHATADLEASEIKAVFPWAKTHIVPNQTSLPDQPLYPTIRSSEARFVFISRISAKKNLDVVLQALQEVSSPLDFDIYGPIEDQAYWARCQDLIATLPSSIRVNYRGELSPDQVRPTFFEYDAFLFPTRGENFGHAIAESLSASCPVICSDQTPWTDVLESGGGAVVRDSLSSSLSSHIEQLASASPDFRHSARVRAGDAYSTWYAGVDKSNIIDVIRAGTPVRPS